MLLTLGFGIWYLSRSCKSAQSKSLHALYMYISVNKCNILIHVRNDVLLSGRAPSCRLFDYKTSKQPACLGFPYQNPKSFHSTQETYATIYSRHCQRSILSTFDLLSTHSLRPPIQLNSSKFKQI